MGARDSMSEMARDEDDKNLLFNEDNYDKWWDALEIKIRYLKNLWRNFQGRRFENS